MSMITLTVAGRNSNVDTAGNLDKLSELLKKEGFKIDLIGNDIFVGRSQTFSETSALVDLSKLTDIYSVMRFLNTITVFKEKATNVSLYIEADGNRFEIDPLSIDRVAFELVKRLDDAGRENAGRSNRIVSGDIYHPNIVIGSSNTIGPTGGEWPRK
jgi:hypothetical protein